MSAGRTAGQPAPGYRPPPRLFVDEDRCTVRVIGERDGRTADFDFTTLLVGNELQKAFAVAFHERTGPAGTIKALSSARTMWVYLRAFSRVLASLPTPPRRVADLTPAHLSQYLLIRGSKVNGSAELGMIMSLLADVEGLPPAVAARCALGHAKRSASPSAASYTRAEEGRIMDAARDTVHAAAVRIRDNHELLTRWRARDPQLLSDPSLYEYCEIVDGVDRTADIPRSGNGRTSEWLQKHGGAEDLMLTVHLSPLEVAAFVVLLIRLTGHNCGTLMGAPAAHHRPDGDTTGPIASTQIDLVKPRRGRRSHMTVSFADLPDWVQGAGTDTDPGGTRSELHTPFGLYMLARELTESARRITGKDLLFQFWVTNRSRGLRTGRPDGRTGVTDWGREQALLADPGGPGPARRLGVRVTRLRKTYLEREQRPVAHTTRTLADTYLRRDPATVPEYQNLVADVLAAEALKARSIGTIAQLTASDLDQAQRDPASVAARFAVTEDTLRLLVARDADTVLAGCSDNHHGPHNAGQPCTASFLKCLDCPCARALPHHLPIQIAALDLLTHKRQEMTALRWAQKFAHPAHQLENLLEQAGPAAEYAAGSVTDADRTLVARLLNREFDRP